MSNTHFHIDGLLPAGGMPLSRHQSDIGHEMAVEGFEEYLSAGVPAKSISWQYPVEQPSIKPNGKQQERNIPHMSDKKKALKKGRKMFEKVYGDILSLPPENQQGAFQDIMLRQLFGEIWAREDLLPIRDRRLMLLGVAAALGETNIFGIQLRAALKNGELTPEQAEETVIHLAPYVGYPRISSIHVLVGQILKERAGS